MTPEQLLEMLEAFDWSAWRSRMRADLWPIYRDVVSVSAGSVLSEFALDDPFTQQVMTAYMGERIVQLETFTKANLSQFLRKVLAEEGGGGSTRELADRIAAEVRTHVRGYETWRAQRIARTESAISYNHGTVFGCKQAGIAKVHVTDGDLDGACAAANGSVWTLEEALANPLGHPNAVMDGTVVRPLGLTSLGYRARWRGPVVRVTTARGIRVTIGPNHPVLTNRGWVPAHRVREGDYVVTDVSDVECRPGAVDSHLHDRPAEIAEIFEAMRARGPHARVVASPLDFHGDGNSCEGEIDIVGTDSLLGIDALATVSEIATQSVLVVAGAEAERFACDRARATGLQGIYGSATSHMSGMDTRRVVGRAPDRDASFAKPMSDHAIADAEMVRDLRSRLTVPITLDHVIHVETDTFVGHAFDLTTSSAAYFANGLLTHNCTRAFSPAVE